MAVASRSWALPGISAALLALTIVVGTLWAQQPARTTATNANSAAEQAIREGTQAYAKAYNAHDAQALAAMWTADGEYVDEDGHAIQGRAAIEKYFADIFASTPGVKLEAETESVRFHGSDVAIESGVARAVPEHGNPTSARYTALLVKQDGKWLLTSVRDARRMPESNYEYLSGLEWLVGNWQASSGDERLSVRFDWVPGKNFLMRSYQVTDGDREVRSGTQVIGWDPRDGEITSWHFDSAGGFGQDRWSKQGPRWYVQASSVLRDGSETSATNIITPVDANSFTWQSTERYLDGRPLPDAAPIQVTRTTASK